MDKEILEQTVTWGDLISWRVHWLNCELNSVLGKISSCTTEESLANLRDTVLSLDHKLGRLVWEVTTTRGLDESEYDLLRIIYKTTKGRAYLKLRGECVDAIRQRYEYLSTVRQGSFMMDLIARDLG